MWGDVPDIITCAKFRNKILRVATLQEGVEIFIFLLIFEWPLQQCSATALPVISRKYIIYRLYQGRCGQNVLGILVLSCIA